MRANAVAVGIVLSKFVEKHITILGREVERTPLRRRGRPEEIAAVVAWLASDESSFVTGETINPGGGWYMSLSGLAASARNCCTFEHVYGVST